MKQIDSKSAQSRHDGLITLFLAGDVMTGRGIDQILRYPSDPLIYEDYIRDARGYVELAEATTGLIPRSVEPSYIWGDALRELENRSPDIRVINLETSITTSNEYWVGKEIQYRMHPGNIECLTAARIMICSLANNHVLDWGYPGLQETIQTLDMVNIKHAGAGMNIREAEAPAIVGVHRKSRVIVFAFGSMTSGVPLSWSAEGDKSGINILNDFSEGTVRRIRDRIQDVKRKGDIIVLSVHWGENWGYEIPREQIRFAHQMIESGVDVIHGHSSHHPKGIEVYKGRLILYGCGDFLNDYEGISGYEKYRNDLGLMYFASMVSSGGNLTRLQMTPTRVEHFKVNKASRAEALWLADILNREGKKFGTGVSLDENSRLSLLWST